MTSLLTLHVQLISDSLLKSYTHFARKWHANSFESNSTCNSCEKEFRLARNTSQLMALHLNTRLQFLHVYLMTCLSFFFEENMFFQLPYIEIF